MGEDVRADARTAGGGGSNVSLIFSILPKYQDGAKIYPCQNKISKQNFRNLVLFAIYKLLRSQSLTRTVFMNGPLPIPKEGLIHVF